MNTPKRWQSTAPSSPQQPQPTTSLSLIVMMALSSTIILIQIQAALQASTRDLLLVVAAGLLALAEKNMPERPQL
jgi:hypothetical protein